jgi:hypothetical protein
MRDTVNPSSRRGLLTGIGLAAFLALAHTMTDTFASMLTALLAWYVLASERGRDAPAADRASQDGANRAMDVSMACRCSACVCPPSPSGDISATPPGVRQDVSHAAASTVDRAHPIFRQLEERI